MKIKLIVLSLLFLANSCPDDSEKGESAEVNCEQEKQWYQDRKSLDNLLFPEPDDLANQESIDIIVYKNSTNPHEISGRYKVKGKIVGKKQLELIIPVTENKLKITNYVNISVPGTNAVLIVLDGNGGKETPNDGVTKVIKKIFKLSELGLKDEFGQLKVFVLHDDNFNAGHVVALKRCITQNPGYGQDCFLYRWPKMERPDELGGDIIP